LTAKSLETNHNLRMIEAVAMLTALLIYEKVAVLGAQNSLNP
jgi:hypothetical protein